MILAVSVPEVLWAVPFSFIVGLVIGLAASSRWVIVRREDSR